MSPASRASAWAPLRAWSAARVPSRRQTAKRVQRAIKQLNFRPSHAARSLLSGSTQMIGVYIPILKGTFYTPILQTIDAELRAGGRHMVVAFGHGRPMSGARPSRACGS